MLFKSSLIATAVACMALLAVAPSTEAHVAIKSPCPRGGTFPGCPGGNPPDYNIRTPIGTNKGLRKNQPFKLCKNTHVQSKRVIYKAGQTIKTEYDVGAPHGGGHCQWALSYDNGKTWVVIKTMIRSCLATAKEGKPYSVPVTIPKEAPNGNAIFMWMWNNAIGNRELYSNCVDITVKGSKSKQIKGVQPLFVNYGSDFPTIPEFPTSKMPDKHELFNTRKAITIKVK
ncbi:hypothetical protein BGZ99_008398 [Dissophora globulifera]|uniref:Chitin-binding type-4 domain-containing protein n=1 Tax=Dissophora globulifera TaxID=979702 RepID=A0A9P6R7D2_9FUNG|nr:hypothetical protein BGZ99_008398 [Dissophora globulifera]